MRKICFGLAILFSIAFTSCGDRAPPKKSAEAVKRRIDPLLENIFITKYPTYASNEIVRGNALKDLLHLADSIAPLNYFSEFPLQVLKIQKNPHGKGALVQWYTNKSYLDKSKLLSDKFNFDLMGFMSESEAAKLNDNARYYVFAHNFRRLTATETFVMVNRVYHAPEAEINISNNYFNAGVFLCEVDSVHQVK